MIRLMVMGVLAVIASLIIGVFLILAIPAILGYLLVKRDTPQMDG